MQITPDDLFAEASAMALELRLKDRALAGLKEENEQLRAKVAEHEGGVPEGGSSVHEHRH